MDQRVKGLRETKRPSFVDSLAINNDRSQHWMRVKTGLEHDTTLRNSKRQELGHEVKIIFI